MTVDLALVRDSLLPPPVIHMIPPTMRKTSERMMAVKRAPWIKKGMRLLAIETALGAKIPGPGLIFWSQLAGDSTPCPPVLPPDCIAVAELGIQVFEEKWQVSVEEQMLDS